MAKITRIYTRAGDSGETGLVGGQRVAKHALRVECFGDIDECSSVIGLARIALAAELTKDPLRTFDAWLGWTQDMLFNLGSDLATLPKDRRDTMPRVTPADVKALESAIDAAQAALPPLDSFIHPGGSSPGGFLHLARAVCRRAERHIVKLSQGEPVEPVVLEYVNRLSDALFVWARFINYGRDAAERRWDPKSRPPDSF